MNKKPDIDPKLKATILADADYNGRPDGTLETGEWAELQHKVATAMSTTNGDTGECVLTARQLALLLASAVQNHDLQNKLSEVVDGFKIIEKNLAIATKADPSQAPFPLVGEAARLHHTASASAYQHALEMCNSETLTRFVENDFREAVKHAANIQARP